jgi:hypothetical protein
MKKTVFFILFLLLSIFSCFSQEFQVPKEELTASQIENKTISELFLMRNSIFAQHGRTFKNYELHCFFMKQPWYKPKEDFNPASLSKMDVQNVELLHAREKELREKNYYQIGEDNYINVENVYNSFQFPDFSTSEKELLNKNGFIVYPTKRKQLFHIYENNDYLGIPSFISVDAVLQLYHLYFDMTLRNVETDFLLPKLDSLLSQLVKEFQLLQKENTNKKIQGAIDYNLAYLGVAQHFASGGKTQIYGNLQEIALAEIKKAKAHQGWEHSDLLGRMFDYSQYVSRGHYTRSEELTNYFLAMMWLGNAGIEVENSENMLASILLTDILYDKKQHDIPLINIWKDIYETTAFYVGFSDDTGPLELKKAMDIVFPNAKTPEDYVKKRKYKKILALLPKEKISGHGSWGKQKKQFRFMGQRFLPDSYVFQRLTSDERKMPNGLDIMAAFGNEKAKKLMLEKYANSWEKFPQYTEELEKILLENKEKSTAEWTQNLYYYWLYNIKSLFEIKDKKDFPFFMSTDGWDVKSLNTSMASWAELRHNTVLYNKQVFAAECAGMGTELRVWVPEPPKGYVEPNVLFYTRMQSLMNFTISELKRRKMLSIQVEQIGEEFIELLSFLLSVSEKEINKINLSLEEYVQIQKMGSLLDNLTLRVLSDNGYSWDFVEGPDKNMPVISDVHTTDFEALEVGVGNAEAIYVIVEIEGRLKMCRGAIFSYYEFPWPLNDRLTDEKWQDILEKEKAPNRPTWINYMSDSKQEKQLLPLYKPFSIDIPESSTNPGWRTIYYDTGC